ncbi:MAG TPA: hypothetical protein VF774_29195 [Pseudoduganella sp.]
MAAAPAVAQNPVPTPLPSLPDQLSLVWANRPMPRELLDRMIDGRPAMASGNEPCRSPA